MATRQGLRRSATDRVLFGVCGGLAQHFGVEAVLVRLAFIVAAFVGGSGIIIYIALALLMPAAGTATVAPADIVRENIRRMPEEAAEAGRRIGGGSGREAVEGQGPLPPSSAPESSQRGRYLLGVILVGVGALFLLSNFGLLSWLSWHTLWPLVLIAIGVAILVRRIR